MKKSLSLMLSLLLCFGLSQEALAAEQAERPFFGDDSIRDVVAVAENLVPNLSLAPNLAGTNQQTGASFIDVKEDDYFAEAVGWAVLQNIAKGTTVNTFSPGDTCTQSQIVTFLYRAVGSPEVSGYMPYSSVIWGDENYDPVLWAHQNGIIDENFFPYTPCTRAEAVRYLYRLFGSPEVRLNNRFTDVSAGDAQAVQWALNQGITRGKTAEHFNPNEVCSRAQIITFLYRALSIS